MDCSAYPLTKCPDNGFCSECNDGSTTKYKLDRCKTGYANVNNTCLKAYASCEDAGWKYSSIPSNMHCDASTNIYLTNGTQKTCYSACSCNDGYVENASGECVKDCSGYPLTQCPTNGVCSKCISGSTTKYKLDSCKEGYKLSGNTCLPNTCSGFTLSACPDNGNCSQCLSGSSYKFRLDSCKDGHKISGNNCIAKTCYDYGGYSSIPTNGLVCKDHKSFKLGTSTGLCYTDCTSCESLSTNVPYRSYSPEEACNSYGNQGPACLYASPNASVSGYTYGRCIIYDAKCPGALPCGDCNMCCSEHSRDNPEICQVLGGNPSDLLPGWND